MATTVSLLKDFSGGQGGGFASYTGYPGHLDSNFTVIETNLNALYAQVSVLGGPDALVALDLIQSTSPLVTTGTIGAHSFALTFGGAPSDSEVTVAAGMAYTGVGRVVAASTLLVAPAFVGPTDLYYIALSSAGIVTLESSAGTGAMDLYSIEVIATDIFDTTTETRLEAVMPDGDDFQDCLTVVGDASAGVAAQTHTKIADRIENLERLVAGLGQLVAGGPAFKGLAMAGTPAAVGLMISDGTTRTVNTGFYRAGANHLAAAIGGTLAWEVNASGQAAWDLQGRGIATVAAETLLRNALTTVSFTATTFDVGDFINSALPSTSIVPPAAAYNGLYLVVAWANFDETSITNGNTGDRELAIRNGVIIKANARQQAATAGDTKMVVAALFEASNPDQLNVRIFQDATTGADDSMAVFVQCAWFRVCSLA